MAEYHVYWEIDIEAESFRDAAEKAREIMINLYSDATIFRVVNTISGGDLLVDVGRYIIQDEDPADEC